MTSSTTANGFVDPLERDKLPVGWSFDARGRVEGWRFSEDVRPWNWVELGKDDARQVWDFLEHFVLFFNARYVERFDHRIPPCWPEHSCLVEEVTTLAFARWQAFSSEHASIGGAQYWHQYSVPGFIDRMGRWLGRDRLERCQQGLHEDPPNGELANETKWQLRRNTIVSLDDTERDRFAREMSEDDRQHLRNTAPRIAFLNKQRSRESSADGQ